LSPEVKHVKIHS